MSDQDLPGALPGLLPRLWRFSLRLTANSHDAEDLVQRACVRALERRHQLQPDTSPLSWLFSIIHSIWLNELRARQIRARTSFEWRDDVIETLADPTEGGPETNLLHRQIIEAVDTLPDAQRTVMLLVVVEGLSYRETADVLGIPIGTVMSRLARARITVGQRFQARSQPKVPAQRGVLKTKKDER